MEGIKEEMAVFIKRHELVEITFDLEIALSLTQSLKKKLSKYDSKALNEARIRILEALKKIIAVAS